MVYVKVDCRMLAMQWLCSTMHCQSCHVLLYRYVRSEASVLGYIIRCNWIPPFKAWNLTMTMLTLISQRPLIRLELRANMFWTFVLCNQFIIRCHTVYLLLVSHILPSMQYWTRSAAWKQKADCCRFWILLHLLTNWNQDMRLWTMKNLNCVKNLRVPLTATLYNSMAVRMSQRILSMHPAILSLCLRWLLACNVLHLTVLFLKYLIVSPVVR